MARAERFLRAPPHPLQARRVAPAPMGPVRVVAFVRWTAGFARRAGVVRPAVDPAPAALTVLVPAQSRVWRSCRVVEPESRREPRQLAERAGPQALGDWALGQGERCRVVQQRLPGDDRNEKAPAER